MIKVFEIKPQTHVRATKGDSIWFRIPEDEITSHGGLLRKRRLERYNEYKANLSGMAKRYGFDLPNSGAAIYFFIPIPKRWTKSKKEAMHMKLHQQKPDLSNLLKAMEDALLPKDETIGHYAGLGKFWVNAEAGWIEVHQNLPVYDPFTRWQQEDTDVTYFSTES